MSPPDELDELTNALLEDQAVPSNAPLTPVSPTALPETPKAQTWEDRVRMAGLTVDGAHRILNDILERGHYEHVFSHFNGRMKFTLRTRDRYSRQRVMSALDMLRTNDPRVHADLQLHLSLAGSLASLDSTVLPFPAGNVTMDVKEAQFQRRLEFVDQIPEPKLEVLYRALSSFDAWVYAALAEDAPKGF